MMTIPARRDLLLAKPAASIDSLIELKSQTAQALLRYATICVISVPSALNTPWADSRD
jgi:hypothetical protein